MSRAGGVTDRGSDKPQEPFDAHFRKARPCNGKRGGTRTVRWGVAGGRRSGIRRRLFWWRWEVRAVDVGWGDL